MRVAIVTETWLPARNGVVTRLSGTVAELSALGHQVAILTPRGRDQAVGACEVVGAPALSLNFVYGGHPWGLPLPGVEARLAAFRPDLVHVVNPVLLGWAGIRLARRLNAPLVCSYHARVDRYASFYHLGFAARLARLDVSAAHRLASLNLATSAIAADEVRSMTGREVGLWPGAVDYHLFRPERARADMRSRLTGGHPERRLLLYVGRLAAEKGVDLLLPLLASDPRYHLGLVGDGPDRRRLAARFANTNATFVGELEGEELACAYASGDVLCFPSATETLGLAILEARAAGLPVVAQETRVSQEVLSGALAAHLADLKDLNAARDAARSALEGVRGEAVAEDARRRVPGWRAASEVLLAHYADAMARSPGAKAA